MPIDPNLVGAAVQIGTNFVTAQQNAAASNRESRQNLFYYNLQRQDALTDQAKQNEYNSPVNQVARMKAAGLNPHAIGGQATVASQSQQLQRTPIAPAPRANQLSSGTTGFMQLMAAKQMQNIEAQTEKTKAETANVLKDGKTKDLQYMADDKNLLNQSTANLMNSIAVLENRQADTLQRQQALVNSKQQLQNMVQDWAMKETERIYQTPFLQGRNNMQQRQISQVVAQTKRIYQEIAQSSESQPYKIRQLQEQIQNLKLTNESDNQFNYYQPDYLRERNRSIEQNNNNMPTEHEAKFDRWLGHFQQITRGLIPYGQDIEDRVTDDGKTWRHTRTTRKRR
ncbi:MAG: DNA pilot protein [Microviridae sp.]|nr:MAG: DNA pilot protein [Microviridae sp.]